MKNLPTSRSQFPPGLGTSSCNSSNSGDLRHISLTRSIADVHEDFGIDPTEVLDMYTTTLKVDTEQGGTAHFPRRRRPLPEFRPGRLENSGPADVDPIDTSANHLLELCRSSIMNWNLGNRRGNPGAVKK